VNHPFATLLYDLFVDPVQRLWNLSTGRKVARARVPIRRTPAPSYGNVAWELEKTNWRAPQPVPVPVELPSTTAGGNRG
jgi:hypothetical protein